MLYFVLSENAALTEYARKASVRAKSAFRPRTFKCYVMLFRSFAAFCMFAKVPLSEISVSVALSYLEFLVENGVSVNMTKNHIAAIKAMFIVHNLEYGSWEHPKVSYFVKSLKLHRPMALPKRNTIDINTLKKMVMLCNQFSDPWVYKAVILTVFFGFFHLSNIAPHAKAEIDSTKHFTGGTFSSCKMRFAYYLNGPRPYSLETNIKWSYCQNWGSNLYVLTMLLRRLWPYTSQQKIPLFSRLAQLLAGRY